MASPGVRADGDASDWQSALESIRAWRCEAGIANAYAGQILEAARDVLAKGAPEWDHGAIVAVAMACHPAMLMVDALREPQRTFESRFGSEDPRDVCPTGYRFLEMDGGRLQGGNGRSKKRWFEGPAARRRFALLSAALIYFEAGMLNDAIAAKDEARIWLARYWLARFFGNLRWASAEGEKRSRAGGENRETKRQQGMKPRIACDLRSIACRSRSGAPAQRR